MIGAANGSTDAVEISGGSFNVELPEDYLAEGTEIKKNEDGTYGVKAVPVAKIGTVEYASLDDAIKAAKDRDVIVLASGVTVYLTNGVANEGSNARKVTIEGDGTQTVDVITYAVSAEGGMLNYQRGSSFTFDRVTVQAGEGNFDGIVCSALTLKKCTLKGKLTLYGAATFTGCTFENTMANQYSIWTWGGTDVKFEGCTFNTNGKAILLYGQATEEKPTNLTVNGCKFNDRMNGAAGKAAIEIGNDYNATYTLVADNCKVNGFAAGKNTGSTLWGNKNSMADEKLTVIKDSEVLKGGAAKVGNKNYATLAEAIAALNSTNHTLTLIDASAWDAATPVYWQAGTQSGYAAKLTDALTAAYKANAGDITIVCRPGADVGAMTHGHVADNLTVYGNNAYISDGECDLEVDRYMYSRETGKQVATGGVYLDKAITITAYELDNLGVWGQRHTGYTINISLNDCDGKAIEGKANVQRVYISGTTGVNNITVVDCDFLTKATALYSNADGKITIDNCSFAGSQVPVNFNHKANGTQTVTVNNSTFTNCGDNGDWKQFAAPVRFVNSGSGTLTATVDNCTFKETVGANGDILLGDGRNGEDSFNVSVTVVNTAAKVQIHQPGYYGADGSTTNANCEKTTVEKSDTPTTFFTVAVAEVTFVDGTVEKYETLIEALKAGLSGKEGTITKLLANGTVSGVTIARIIDLNGYTLTTDDLNLDSSNGKDLIVTDSSNDKNGKLVITGSAKKMSIAHKIILKSGTIETSRTINQDYGVNNTIEINGGKLILKNGATLTNSMPRTVTINGGTIITDAGESIFKAGSSTLDVKIKGGDFTQVGKLTESTSNIKFSISGGTFSADVPEEYCAKDYYPAHFNDGTKGVKKETVSTEEELRRALYEAALDGSLTRIKLTGNIKLEMLYAAENFGTEKLNDNAIGDTFNRYKLGVHPTAEKPDQWNPLVINQTQKERVVYGAYYHVSATDERIARLVIKAGQNVVIDLNGYTIEKNARATHGDWSNTCTDIIGNYGTLEIKNSAGTNGTIKGNGYISCNGAVLHNYEGGVMTVGAVNVDGNAAGMTAGTGQYVIANDGGKTIINGTNVHDTATSASLVVNTAGEITIKGNATLNHPETKTINVKGGDVIIESATIISDKYSIYAAEGKTTITGKVTVNGTGKMAVESGEIVKTATATIGGVPAGYAWFDNDDGTQSLGKAYAKIGETYYKSLADALEAANAGDTIVLLDNVTLNSPLAISKDVTIDLNKKTIDTKAGVRAITITSGNVTIKNGTVKMGTVVNGSTSESGYTIYVNTAKGENVTLNLEDVTVIGGENQKSGVTDATVDALKANGMYSNQTTAGTALYIYGKKSVGNTIVNIKNSTIIGGYGSATNGTQTKYISGGANMADGGDAITAIGDKVVLTIIDGSTIKGGDSDLHNAGIGVELQSGTLTVDGSTVTGGSCLKCDKSYGIAGDAVYVGSVAKSATIKNSTIIGGNGGYSYDGSGIEIRKNVNAPATVTVEGSTIKSGNGENANKDYAGAIYLSGWDDSADLTFKGDNTLAGSDGEYGVIRGGVTDGIKLDGNLTIDEGTLKKTLLTEVSAGSTIKSGENAKVDADTVASTDENAAMNTTPAADGTYSFVAAVAQVIDRADNKLSYASIDAAIAAADAGETVKLLADVTADVVITANKSITLDLNGKTLNGGTGNTKATITNYGTITITDSSAEKTGTIKRDDNGTEGETSYYVIRNFGTMTIEQANIINNSGYKKTNPSGSMVGSSLICNGDDDAYSAVLNIKGGTIRQDNFIAIKNGSSATLNVTGGKITSKHSAVQNWCNANITGGELNGQLWTDSWDSNSTGNTVMGGDAKFTGEIVIDITGSIVPKFKITGGTLDVTNWGITTAAANAGAKPAVSGGTFSSAVPEEYCADRYIPTQNADGTYGVQEATKGSKNYPYTLAELSVMTRDVYIAAQKALGSTMYVEIGDYSYDKNGVLGNGVRNDTPGQMPDHSKLNSYGENGYIGANNDGANGKNIIFVGGSITSGVTGYTSIDNIGTSLLLAVPAYTNVTFEGVTFENVMSFDYQLYTSPWSQLGELKFSGCTFNGLIVGAIAAQTLTFNGCEFKNYTNTTEANNSNPTWIRPAYGNWTKGDNDGQGSDFKSLTTINFTKNKVTSTRPVKFERIAQWEMDTKVSVTGNEFDIKSDGSSKNVGLYFGANAKFDLTLDGNEKLGATSALYTAVYKAPNGTDYAGLPAGSTVKDSNGADVEVAGVIWKSTDALTLKTTTEAVELVNSKGISVKFATLEEAFAAAKNGDKITLLSDVEMTEIIRVTDSKKITLALNGFNVTITATGKFIRVCNAELTITGNGTIKEQNPYFAPIIIKGGAEGSENYSVVNIKEGVTLEGWAGVMIDQTSGTANNYGMDLNVEGATLNGVNDTDGASGSGIYVNGVVEDAKITLTNTTVTGTGAGMYLAGNADTTINGGSVKGDATGIEIRAGKLTLNNCDVTGGNGEVTATANGNGTTVTNAALAISQHTTKKPIDVTINGGTFNGTAAVYQTDVQGTGSADVKIAVKSGTFNGTISGETDGTITISGGKFKFKVDDKYFANGHVCSGNPGADGYYTIADHPITNMGLSIGEGLSLRIYLLDGVTTGKLRVTYTKPDGEEVSYIIDETEFELVGNEESGYTEKYFFRIFNITPQMADMTITVQYIGEDGKDFGSAKEVSILKYCEGYIAKYPTENVKTFVSKLLEYCASAMDYVAIKYSEQVYNGKTWTERATALRAEKERLCGTDVPTFDFKELGTNSKFGRKIFDTNGIIFGESLTFYLGIRKENYNPDYHYIPTGSNETKPVFDEKSGEYRFYFTMAPYEYNTSMRIVVKSGNSTICERATSLDFLLNKYSAGDSAAARFCKAAYEYCRALEAVIKDINK